MKKSIFSLVLFLFLSSTVFGQDQEGKIQLALNFSQPIKERKKTDELTFVVKDKSSGFIVGLKKKHGKGYYIRHYDQQLNLVQELEYKLSGKKGEIKDAFLLKNGDLCILEFYNNSRKKTLDYYANISPTDHFAFKKKLLLSISRKKAKGRSSFSLNEDGDTHGNFSMSANKKYFALTIELDAKKMEKHQIYVFDNELHKIYQNTFERKLADRKFRLENVDINEKDGTLLLLGKSYTRKKKKKGGKYQFELYKIKANGMKRLFFDSKDKYIGSLSIKYKEDKVFCVGFYSEKNDYRYKGLVFFDIDLEQMKLKNSVYSPFSKQFLIDKYGKAKQKELHNIRLDHIFYDGTNFVITAEERGYHIYTSFRPAGPNGGGGMSTTVVAFYNDIIVTKLNKQGKMIWARNINKSQQGKPSYNSYTALFTNNHIYLFLNAAKNAKKLKNKRLAFNTGTFSSYNLYAIVFDTQGKYQYEKIVDKKKTKSVFMAGNGIVSNNHKDVIFPGKNKSKTRLLKIHIPD